MGKLFVVSTPIGNLEDITLRAKKVLAEVDLVACEDTRKTGMLLARLNLPKKELLSYYEENESKRIPEIIQLIKLGKNIALVSNAGTPTISDPGFKLVRECIAEGITIETIPGASSVLAALVASGLPTDKFLFLGYPPKKDSKRKKLLQSYKTVPVSCTFIFYESPYRLLETLSDLMSVFGDIQIVLCRELTKVFEEIKRGKISDLLPYYKATKPQGEFTLLFHQEHQIIASP